MKVFNLVLALGAMMLLASGPVSAETVQYTVQPPDVPAIDAPAGIAAAIGVGFDAMTIDILAFGVFCLVSALVWGFVVVPAFRRDRFAAGSLVPEEPRKPPA